MTNIYRPAFTFVVLFTLLLGIAYPLSITGISLALMPANARGSLIVSNDKIIGSSLIGQAFTSERYFWPRPSATGEFPYNAAASSGTNLGTTSQKLKDMVKVEIDRLHSAGIIGALPVDAVTSSGSGLDPHISPDYARDQVARVAKARNLDVAKVGALVESHIEGRSFGFIGEPRVNVLRLNMALDSLQP
ncbi:potassium-transporting ATPase subunit KdpC [Rhizobium sp. KVB221]|uniref:Potassium-transporting ATPase KdpC subunit n=1 Tax=Rhizobium setariae TaxID=2801340 RepID=A0A936YQE3_9HYPH|nr:potassium-transporting ATPase subunit KdpC [Rhizobium setariae]MBL0372304.1 potassium-transporting ATPase subunit KdpC [Rhizobium setariae]